MTRAGAVQPPAAARRPETAGGAHVKGGEVEAARRPAAGGRGAPIPHPTTPPAAAGNAGAELCLCG